MKEQEFVAVRLEASAADVRRSNPAPTSGTIVGDPIRPSDDELRGLFLDKYGASELVGWAPGRRLKAGYFLPVDIYEAVVTKHVFQGCAWLDVGGGRHIFPEHPKLARRLVSRCSRVAAVDPAPTVYDNAFVTERHQCPIESFVDERRFHLATFRMVVEHIENPARVLRRLRGLLVPGATVIVLTVNRWSPCSLVSRVVPFRLHHPLKHVFWGGDARDTFPTKYRLNTHAALHRAFDGEGFVESGFAYLDDLSLFGGFKSLNAVEIAAWRIFHRAGLTYPEHCLLAIYRTPSETT